MNSGPSSFVVSQSPANGSPHCGKPAPLAPSVMEVSRGVKRRVAMGVSQNRRTTARSCPTKRPGPTKLGHTRCNLPETGIGATSPLCFSFPSQSPENGSRLCKVEAMAAYAAKMDVVSQSPENGSRLCKRAATVATFDPRLNACSQSPENGSRLCKSDHRGSHP